MTYIDITQLGRAEFKSRKMLNCSIFVNKKSKGPVLG